jgi:hypothetical protein
LSVDVQTSQQMAMNADQIAEFLGLAKISIVQGGPSPIDPEGKISWYAGFRDAEGNGFHVGVSVFGKIVKCGATIGNRSYCIPPVEEVR